MKQRKGQRMRIRIAAKSLVKAVRLGDRIVVSPERQPKVGDVVLVRHKTGKEVVCSYPTKHKVLGVVTWAGRQI